MMNRLVVAVSVLTVLMASPALAKKPAKKSGGAWSGFYCEQGGNNAFFPKASLPAKYRNSFRKGQKVKVNLAEYGPIWCVAY
jgi:hypothetical protein